MEKCGAYELIREKCKAAYTGKTLKTFRTRIKEHKFDLVKHFKILHLEDRNIHFFNLEALQIYKVQRNSDKPSPKQFPGVQTATLYTNFCI